MDFKVDSKVVFNFVFFKNKHQKSYNVLTYIIAYFTVLQLSLIQLLIAFSDNSIKVQFCTGLIKIFIIVISIFNFILVYSYFFKRKKMLSIQSKYIHNQFFIFRIVAGKFFFIAMIIFYIFSYLMFENSLSMVCR